MHETRPAFDMAGRTAFFSCRPDVACGCQVAGLFSAAAAGILMPLRARRGKQQSQPEEADSGGGGSGGGAVINKAPARERVSYADL